MRFSVLISLAAGISLGSCAPQAAATTAPSVTADAAEPVNSVNLILDDGKGPPEEEGSGGAGEAGRVVGGPGVPEPYKDPNAKTTSVTLVFDSGSGSGAMGEVAGGVGPSSPSEPIPTITNTATLDIPRDRNHREGSGGAGEAGRVVGGPGVPEPVKDPNAMTTSVTLIIENGSGGAGEGLAAGKGPN